MSRSSSAELKRLRERLSALETNAGHEAEINFIKAQVRRLEEELAAARKDREVSPAELQRQVAMRVAMQEKRKPRG